MVRHGDKPGGGLFDYLWPACQWGRYDGTKPMLKWDTAWRALRDAAGLSGLRFHDLRHTVITELAELGAASHVLESISGHLSRRMLEHYSGIHIDAKRQALDALDEARRRTDGTVVLSLLKLDSEGSVQTISWREPRVTLKGAEA
jgi:integrase